MGKLVAASVGVVVASVLAFSGLLVAFGASGGAAAEQTGAGGSVRAGAPVPGWLRELIEKSAGECPQVTPSLLAAQLYAESGFDPHAVSPVGARGIAQFMPGTWKTWGRDGDGDGRKDVTDPQDAVAAQAAYDCALAEDVRDVPGDAMENMLAAYNAGPGAVLKYGGVPPYAETRRYVERIRELAEKWAAPSQESDKQRVVAAAKSALGTWYQWGGTCTPPYRGAGACDCSSLVKRAWAASGVSLPRVTYDQVDVGTPVDSVSQLRPGDLIFSVGSADHPEHVAMYLGDGRVIDAPRTGTQVRITPLSHWTPQVVAMRHIA